MRSGSLSRLCASAACASSISCSGEPTTNTPPRACKDVELIVAASDYSSSVVCGAPGCVAGPGTTGADLGADPQLATTNGRAFFLARDNDLLFEIDTACGTPSARFSVHDLAPKDPATGEVDFGSADEPDLEFDPVGDLGGSPPARG